MPFIPHTQADEREMLAAIGADGINALFDEVPTELRKRREARIREAGGSPFERFALGKMLLHL
ncbi:MAG: glycine dehydrogenase, partial [Gammaproteobacteria bacterium]